MTETVYNGKRPALSDRERLNKRPRRVHIPGHGSPVSCRAVGLIGAALVIAAFSPAESCFSPSKLENREELTGVHREPDSTLTARLSSEGSNARHGTHARGARVGEAAAKCLCEIHLCTTHVRR